MNKLYTNKCVHNKCDSKSKHHKCDSTKNISISSNCNYYKPDFVNVQVTDSQNLRSIPMCGSYKRSATNNRSCATNKSFTRKQPSYIMNTTSSEVYFIYVFMCCTWICMAYLG